MSKTIGIHQHGHIISNSELQRMRASTLPPTENHSREERRKHLKHLSNEKLKHWPNTLEALRTKKESAAKEREERQEIRRREVDKEEAQLRRQTRFEAIDRANKLIYEQTDRMKVLRSQELLSDVLHKRRYQIDEKEDKISSHKKEMDAYHQVILKTVADGDAADRRKEEKDLQKIEEIKVARFKQLEEVREKKQRHADEQIKIGNELKRQAEEQLEQERLNRIEKAEKIKKGNEDLKIANEKLKIVRDEYRQLEVEENMRREAEVDVIENRKKVRKALEIRKFEKAQESRKKIIEAATKQLKNTSQKEEAITLKQFNEYKEKEEKAIRDKETKRIKEWNAIMESRTAQVKAKKVQKEKEMEEEMKLLELYQSQMDLANEKEETKVRKARNATIECKAEQLAHAARQQKDKVENRILLIEKERALRNQYDGDDEKFKQICMDDIAKFEAEGKPTYPLYRAMEYKQPEILPVSGFRV